MHTCHLKVHQLPPEIASTVEKTQKRSSCCHGFPCRTVQLLGVDEQAAPPPCLGRRRRGAQRGRGEAGAGSGGRARRRREREAAVGAGGLLLHARPELGGDLVLPTQATSVGCSTSPETCRVNYLVADRSFVRRDRDTPCVFLLSLVSGRCLFLN